jgi:two-component system response regulator AtoC
MVDRESSSFRTALLENDEATRLPIEAQLRHLRVQVVEARDAAQALDLLSREAFDVFIADIDDAEIAYQDFLKSCKRISRETAIVLLTGEVDVEMAFEAARLGAFQCIAKPADIERLRDVVDQALDSARLRREARSVRQIIVGHRQTDRFVVGKSKMMQKIAEIIEKVAASQASTVLIQGESGTGKELVAKAIHFRGSGKIKPFMEINCASLPENLLESELFGYEKGAFTDAKGRKKGLVELAEGGTLFLDEVAEMPLGLQARLLRLIESKRFRRVGGVEDIEVTTRIVAATNRDLRAAMEQGRFRDDLYFRLMVIPIYVPALRERREDIAILATHFIDHFNKELTRSVRGLSREAQQVMVGYDWPGNVRELRNVIERAILLESKDLVLPEHLPKEIMETSTRPDLGLDSSGGRTVPISLKEAERVAIVEALNWASGNKTKAARVLGITRQTLRQKIRALGVENN